MITKYDLIFNQSFNQIPDNFKSIARISELRVYVLQIHYFLSCLSYTKVFLILTVLSRPLGTFQVMFIHPAFCIFPFLTPLFAFRSAVVNLTI